MQLLNKRFYNVFIPALIENVKLYDLGNVAQGVIVFPGQNYVNVLDPKKSLVNWTQLPVKIDTSAEEILEVARLAAAQDEMEEKTEDGCDFFNKI